MNVAGSSAKSDEEQKFWTRHQPYARKGDDLPRGKSRKQARRVASQASVVEVITLDQENKKIGEPRVLKQVIFKNNPTLSTEIDQSKKTDANQMLPVLNLDNDSELMIPSTQEVSDAIDSFMAELVLSPSNLPTTPSAAQVDLQAQIANYLGVADKHNSPSASCASKTDLPREQSHLLVDFNNPVPSTSFASETSLTALQKLPLVNDLDVSQECKLELSNFSQEIIRSRSVEITKFKKMCESLQKTEDEIVFQIQQQQLEIQQKQNKLLEIKSCHEGFLDEIKRLEDSLKCFRMY